MTVHLAQTGGKKRLTSRLKDVAALAALFSLGLLATGCSLPGSSNTASKTPPKIQIRIWRVNQDPDTLRDIAADFMKQYPQVSVTYQNNSLDGYELKSLRSLAGKQGPDIWSIPNDWLADEKAQIMPLPDNFFFPAGAKTGPSPADSVRKLYPAGIAEQLVREDGKVYGLPTNVDLLQLYYNPAYMSNAAEYYRSSLGPNPPDAKVLPVRQLLSHPPSTWSELLNQVPYLTIRSGTSLSRSAIALGTADNISNAQDILQLLMLQNGAKIVGSDHQRALFHIPITTPSGGEVRPGEQALSFFTSFSDPSKANYTWSQAQPQALDAFAQGKVGMVLAYADFAQQLAVKYPRFTSYQVAPVPQISATQPPVNFIRFYVETVTQTADNPAAAFTFLKQYTNESATKNLASNVKLFSPYLKTLATNDKGGLIATGQTTYKYQHDQFDAVFRQMIVDASQNGVPASQAIDLGAERINELLASRKN